MLNSVADHATDIPYVVIMVKLRLSLILFIYFIPKNYLTLLNYLRCVCHYYVNFPSITTTVPMNRKENTDQTIQNTSKKEGGHLHISSQDN